VFIKKNNMYKLVKIFDSGSERKSIKASQLCQITLRSLIPGAIYEKGEAHLQSCDNTDSRCLPKGRKKCNHPICDVFYLEHIESGKIIKIGNSCISRFCSKGLIDNIDNDKYDFVRRVMKNKKDRKLCIFCGHFVSNNKNPLEDGHRAFHKVCLKGEGKKLSEMRKSIILNNKNLLKEVVKIAKKNLSRDIVIKEVGIDNYVNIMNLTHSVISQKIRRGIISEYVLRGVKRLSEKRTYESSKKADELCERIEVEGDSIIYKSRKLEEVYENYMKYGCVFYYPSVYVA
jgi:hypothetical protein